MAAAETEDDIGRLFSVRPADFVKERGAIAKALKAAGRRADATTVEKLPRPTLSVWVVNQIARREPALVRRLAEATARLQGENAGASSSYVDALAEHREVVKALRLEAEEILRASGFRPAPDLLTQVVHDLRAGMSSPESGPLIESGRLVRDVAAESAMNPFVGAPEAAPRAETDDQGARARQEARAREEARAFQKRRIENLRERVASAQVASERAERDVEAAGRALKEAERRLETSRAALARASAELEAAESSITTS